MIFDGALTDLQVSSDIRARLPGQIGVYDYGLRLGWSKTLKQGFPSGKGSLILVIHASQQNKRQLATQGGWARRRRHILIAWASRPWGPGAYKSTTGRENAQ